MADAVNETEEMNDQVRDFQVDLDQGIAKINAKIQKFINKINEVLSKAQQQSQAWIDRQIELIKSKYEEFKAKAMKWLNDKLKKINDWIKKQVDAIKYQIKYSEAYMMVSIICAATKVPMTKKMVEKTAEGMPEPPIPTPKVPNPGLPFPELPIPEIKVPTLKVPNPGTIPDLRYVSDKLKSAAGL